MRLHIYTLHQGISLTSDLSSGYLVPAYEASHDKHNVQSIRVHLFKNCEKCKQKKSTIYITDESKHSHNYQCCTQVHTQNVRYTCYSAVL